MSTTFEKPSSLDVKHYENHIFTFTIVSPAEGLSKAM